MIAIILGIFRYVLGFYFQNDGGNDFTALDQDFISKINFQINTHLLNKCKLKHFKKINSSHRHTHVSTYRTYVLNINIDGKYVRILKFPQ